jgi:hypothetical protein
MMESLRRRAARVDRAIEFFWIYACAELPFEGYPAVVCLSDDEPEHAPFSCSGSPKTRVLIARGPPRPDHRAHNISGD